MVSMGYLEGPVWMVKYLVRDRACYSVFGIRNTLAEAEWAVARKGGVPVKCRASEGFVQELCVMLVGIDPVDARPGAGGSIGRLGLVKVMESER